MSEIKGWKETVEKCKAMLSKFKPNHKRVTIFIGFDVEPAIYYECPHFTDPKSAMEFALREDESYEQYKKDFGKKK